MNMNTKEMLIEKAEKMAAFLKDAESLPSMKVFRAEQAAVLRATRTEAVGKIEVLKKEQGEAIPRLIADRDAKEVKYKEAKAALDTAVGEFNTARSRLMIEGQSFNGQISGQEQILFETADPLIDAAIQFFRGKLDWLRSPGRVSRNAVGGENNLITETKTLKTESNRDAILGALQYCQDAIGELERTKLVPELDLAKIEKMKAMIPSIDVYTEYTGEKPYGRTVANVVSRFGGAASDAYEQTLLDRVIKKANDLISKPAKPPLAKKRGENGAEATRKEATMETYRKRGAGYFAAEGTYNYRGGKS